MSDPGRASDDLALRERLRTSSILYRPGDDADLEPTATTPTFAIDLGLDEIFAGMAAGAPGAAFYERLTDPDAVTFRHEVFRDLETPDTLDAVTAFAEGIQAVHGHLVDASTIALPAERQRWQLESAHIYQTAVTALADAFAHTPPRSRALIAFAAAIAAYVSTDDFTTFVTDTDRMLADLAAVTYRLRLGENRVVVGRDDDAPDYGAEVLATFARFRPSAAATSVSVDIFATADMNRVEAEILARVARLHPAVFAALDTYARRHAAFLEPAASTFADEIRFYLAWLDRIGPLRAAGLPFCYPTVATGAHGTKVRSLFDLALALRRTPAGDGIVTNDLDLAETERIVVVTGPHQGGKTAFARAIGQIHHLASIGIPVPAVEARLTLAPSLHTLFARAEDPDELTGRLEAELVRAREILDDLRPNSVVIFNESFASTTVDDALALSRAVIAEIARRDAICVVVTFLGELSSFDASTVSMTGVIDPLDPTRPTYRLERRPADDLAYARALAERHRLDHDAIRDRVNRHSDGPAT